MKPTYQIVVAKYNEDMQWLTKMDPEPLVIYDKGDAPLPPELSGLRVQFLENVGREADTYLHHVVHNYDSLPDYLIFMQGHPFDHMLGVTSDNLQMMIHDLINIRHQDVHPLFTNWYWESYDMYPSLNAKEYFEHLFEGPTPEQKVFAHGCQYIVPKQLILCKPLEFYKRLNNMIKRNKCSFDEVHYGHCEFDPNSLNAWTFERLGGHIFGRSKVRDSQGV